MKVMHVITGTSVGGAEMMLYKLLKQHREMGIRAQVISLCEIGPIGHKISEMGIPVYFAGFERGKFSLEAFLRLVRLIHAGCPDIVQTWMYHADLIGGIAAKICGCSIVLWGIRNSDLDANLANWKTIWVMRGCALLSRAIPSGIVSCSHASARLHIALGYDEARMRVISNGFDTELFCPSTEHRTEFRKRLGIPEEATVVGMVARYDPQKDFGCFFDAAHLILKQTPGTRFLLCGKDVQEGTEGIRCALARVGHRDNFYLLGLQTDVARIMAAVDVGVLSSKFGEGFPNTVGEMMACGVPCVVTDVGDSAFVVGDAGLTVPPGDSEALAGALLTLIKSTSAARQALGYRARARILGNFTLPVIARKYRETYSEYLRARILRGPDSYCDVVDSI